MNAELDRVQKQTGQHASRARKPVLAHPQVVTSGAAQRDVSDRAVRAREREPLGDFPRPRRNRDMGCALA